MLKCSIVGMPYHDVAVAMSIAAAAAARDAEGGAAEFNPASPDGSYTLHLSVAVERAVAVQLASIDRASGSDLMKNIRLDGKVGGGGPCQFEGAIVRYGICTRTHLRVA